MTIIEMAIQAGIKRRTDVFYSEYCDGIYGGDLEAFAKLVEDAAFVRWAAQTKLAVQEEREACAKEADKRLHDFTMLTSNPPQSGAAFSIAQAIRARGEA